MITHLIRDNEYGEAWCDDEHWINGTSDIKRVGCQACLLALIDAAYAAAHRYSELRAKENPADLSHVVIATQPAGGGCQYDECGVCGTRRP